MLGWALTPARRRLDGRPKVLLVPVMVLSGAAIFAAVFVAGAAFQFWAQDAAEVQNSFTYGGTTLLQYPPTVFAKDLVRGVTFVVPLAFVNWLPALYVLGRPDPLGLPGWVAFLRRWWRAGVLRAGGAGVAGGAARVPEHGQLTAAQGGHANGTTEEARGERCRRDAASSSSTASRRSSTVRRKAGPAAPGAAGGAGGRRRSPSGCARGEMVGYIGPNGAGKSTTIKMLTGILTPSGGRLRVAGIDPSRERTRLARRIGVVFGQRTTLWWDLPLQDSYGLVRRMYRIPDARYRENLDRCVELLDLGDLLDVPVRQLSLGQRMRGDIAAALLHDPEVLYLDEPTIGLDVVSKAKVRGFLRELNAERGTTVLLTTHDLTDIEQLCQRVMVIDHGRLMYDGGARRAARGRARASGRWWWTWSGNCRRSRAYRARVRCRVDGPAAVAGVPGVAESAAPLVARIAAAYPLVDLSVREPDIEAVIAELYAERRGRRRGCRGGAGRNVRATALVGCPYD